MRLVDLTGHKYGILTVKTLLPKTRKEREWLCECECGGVCVVHAANLRSGNTVSCGCARIKYTDHTTGAFHGVVARYVSQARDRGLEWALSAAACQTLMAANCTYCGGPPSNTATVKSSVFIYNGIDRIDSSKGYKSDNVTSACKTCNWAKSAMSTIEFQAWVTRVYHHFTQNGLAQLNTNC